MDSSDENIQVKEVDLTETTMDFPDANEDPLYIHYLLASLDTERISHLCSDIDREEDKILLLELMDADEDFDGIGFFESKFMLYVLEEGEEDLFVDDMDTYHLSLQLRETPQPRPRLKTNRISFRRIY